MSGLVIAVVLLALLSASAYGVALIFWCLYTKIRAERDSLSGTVRSLIQILGKRPFAEGIEFVTAGEEGDAVRFKIRSVECPAELCHEVLDTETAQAHYWKQHICYPDVI